MNSKKSSFFISYSILIAFIVVVVLVSNYFLVLFFGFNKDNFIFITLFLIVFAILLNIFLGKPLLEPLFRSDENLKKSVKETLHELNIPASTIQANVQMLEKNITNEKDKKRLNRIKLATKELIKLYDQMEYEIKKEINSIDFQEFDIKDLVHSSIEKFSDIKKTIQIETSLDSCIVNSDKNGFEKIIDNLLSNAIKYNRENGIVQIKLENGVLSFYNSGKPIDTKNLFIVFEQYFQEDNSKKGFGLGLNIVKEFCDNNKIDIKIEPKTSGTLIKLSLQKLIN